MAKKIRFETVEFSKITPGGQAIGELEDGKKCFAWGVLPGEKAIIQITKNKSTFCEGYAVEILKESPHRIQPVDSDSYLSTSPWQIFDFAFEQKTKKELILESFRQEKITLEQQPFYSDSEIFNYRNKVEFSFWYEKNEDSEEEGQLNLAFFKRGGRGKVPVKGTSLDKKEINQAGQKVLKILQNRKTFAKDLKTLLIRSNQKGDIAAQLYVKDTNFKLFDSQEIKSLGNNFKCFEIIYSNPKSPASVITERLQTIGERNLSDEILGIKFNYATEGFFQINLPVYQKALEDMSKFIDKDKETVDLYSGVGSIGLTIGKGNLKLIEINPFAVEEMKNNIARLNIDNAEAILSPSEKALEYISNKANLIVDPPRAGMDKKVCEKILEVEPEKIIYLSCNVSTQARDIAILSQKYDIIYSKGYNFFPRTPHIENLVILKLKKEYK